MALLDVRDLVVRFRTADGTIHAVNGVSFELEGGEVVFDGIDLLSIPEADLREIRGKEIAMIFQDPMTSLNPVLTIEEQLVETIRAHRKVSREDARSRAIELLGM